MADIVIKKRVSLDTLGEEYKDSYLEFKSIAMGEYENILQKLETGKSKIDSIKLITEVLEQYFMGGQVKGEEATKENIAQLDQELSTKCFEVITGQNTDPKSEGQ